ncbi:hypothetical protein JXA80_01305 [bacterium]|nr:hypothetical protein [candidate division CSSED10-310 bacterium]
MDTVGVTCARCGRFIQRGDPVWHIHLTLTADTADGWHGYDANTPEDVDTQLNALLQRIDLIPQDMLENQVFQAFHCVVCRTCRDILAANPWQRPWEQDA